ncbi:MAG: hypothetical protein LBH70_09890 [Spirochaetaceae bacterium]|nr:hypothetical protein [Spirochaetaceae bacterium]
MKLKKKRELSSQGGFTAYILASFFIVMGFRLVFPGEPPPIAFFSYSWRISRGLLDWIGLFPALVMSALVVPFGLSNDDGEFSFSSPAQFLDVFKGPIITAVSASVVYGILCFLVYPVVWDWETDMRFQGRLYSESYSRARSLAVAGDWANASRFLGICERIWPNSPDLEDLRTIALFEMDDYYSERPESPDPALPASSASEEPDTVNRRTPVNAAEALARAETAFQEERYYDAHWLATLSGRLAREGSVESVEAVRTASRAWNAVASLEPNTREIQSGRLYRLKNSAYESMIAQDWIRGYYLFKELEILTPRDPDIANFVKECEQGLQRIAFFIDEFEIPLGEILSGAVFSVPRRTASGVSYGRMILQIRSLAASPDYSYGIGIDLLVFDENGAIENRLSSQYAKILPRTIKDQKRTLLLLRALDRKNENWRWEPEWAGPGQPGAIRYDIGDLNLGDAQVMLDIPYEDFLLSTQVRRGVDNFFISELFAAQKTLDAYGYVSQVFAAEILSRFAEPVYFLALLILSIIIGWRYRTARRPRYLSIPLLFILPLVFAGVVLIYRAAMHILGIWLVLSLSFVPALIVTFAGAFLLFVLFLIGLAYQYE